MFKRITFSVIVLSFFLASPAYSAKKGDDNECEVDTVAGSYVFAEQVQYPAFDGGTVDRIFLNQLNLSSDGIAVRRFTGAQDMFDVYGGPSTWIGSWECRKDGKLLMTTYRAGYRQVVDGLDPFDGTPVQASELRFHLKTSWLFVVISTDTLRRIEVRSTYYNMSEDPTDPDAGILGASSFIETEYNRVKPTDVFLSQ